jgi:hypothetical protein
MTSVTDCQITDASPGWGTTLKVGSDGLTMAMSHWEMALQLDTVARCRLWNRMELREETWPAQVEIINPLSDGNGYVLACMVRIPFAGCVIRFDLHLVVDNLAGSVVVTLPSESISELDSQAAVLLAMDLMPGLGAATAGDVGYLFLPCFAGVLHRFDHRVSRELLLTLYAQQQQWPMHCHFNLFGIQTDRYAWCAIVTHGDRNAQLVIRSHHEEDRQYSVHPSCVYRWDQGDAMITGDRQVTYHLLEPDEQNYNRFARLYRDWLRSERQLQTLEQKTQHHPAARDLAQTFLLKIMMGYKQSNPAGLGAYQSCTTYAQIRTLLAKMQDDGIAHLTAQLVGWNTQGHDGCYPQRFPVNEDAGGELAMRQLIQWAQAKKIQISVHDNYSDSYECGDDFDLDHVIINRDGQPWRNVPWAGGYNWRLCPLQSIQYVHRDMPRIADLGVKANYYLDAIGALSTCHSKVHPADRDQIINGFREIFTTARQHFDTVSTEVAFAPYFDLFDGVYLPYGVEKYRRWTDFVDQFVDEHVPALAVVLHNGIRYHFSNDVALQGHRGALMDIAWGAMPFVEIAHDSVPGAHGMPSYEQVREYTMSAWELCCQQYSDRAWVDLHAIERVSDEVWRTQYADGLTFEVDLNQGVLQTV